MSKMVREKKKKTHVLSLHGAYSLEKKTGTDQNHTNIHKITAVVRARKGGKCLMRVCHWDVDLDMEVRGFLRLEGTKEGVGREEGRAACTKALGQENIGSIEEEQQKIFKLMV